MKKLTSNCKLKVMKKYIIYITIILALLYSGCDKPGPTELVDDETFDVEIVGKEIDNEYYTNGFDTSGVIENNTNYSSIVSISGIKLTKAGLTAKISSAQAIIFDKSKPVKSASGFLLGYKTITPGIIRFDNTVARLSNYRILYRESGVLIDTVLGKKYELFNINERLIYDPFIFPYNSTISFSYIPFIGDQELNYNIITPKEITGNLNIAKTDNQNNFKFELNWDGESVNNFSVIIGGVLIHNQKVFPFYRVKTRDDGNLVIPSSLLKNIPRDRFNKISISLIRKYDKLAQLLNSELYVVSQSIHTIIVDIP